MMFWIRSFVFFSVLRISLFSTLIESSSNSIIFFMLLISWIVTFTYSSIAVFSSIIIFPSSLILWFSWVLIFSSLLCYFFLLLFSSNIFCLRSFTCSSGISWSFVLGSVVLIARNSFRFSDLASFILSVFWFLFILLVLFLCSLFCLGSNWFSIVQNYIKYIDNAFESDVKAQDIRGFLSKELRYSYKRGSSRPRMSMKRKSKYLNAIFSSRMLLAWYNKDLIINLDESNYNRSVKSNYSWLPIGESSSIINTNWTGRTTIFLDWLAMDTRCACQSMGQ